MAQEAMRILAQYREADVRLADGTIGTALVKHPREGGDAIWGFRVTPSGTVDTNTGKGHILVGEGIVQTIGFSGTGYFAVGGIGGLNQSDPVPDTVTGGSLNRTWFIPASSPLVPIEVQDGFYIWAPLQYDFIDLLTSFTDPHVYVELYQRFITNLGINQTSPSIYLAAALDPGWVIDQPPDSYGAGSGTSYWPIAKITISGASMDIQQIQYGPIVAQNWYFVHSINAAYTP